ncbi:lactococcin 972 family bacteriocin [Mycoplasma sp. P36-A1]|uniref:lactococcin 972 family bacteriocin n=1 Tax=Mycoplasma sp. P36-A1 TaxID=3252900 RepID=UPI003C2EBD2B
MIRIKIAFTILIISMCSYSLQAATLKFDNNRGTFSYGLRISIFGDKQYSDVYHTTKKHSATVKVRYRGDNFDLTFKAEAPARVWAKTSSPKWGSYSQRNSYYNFW